MEESVRLISAATDDEAREKRDAIARSGERSYTNPDAGMVKWAVYEVGEVQHLGSSSFAEGEEVFSRLFYLGDR